jgi:hypothetical protein
MERMFAVAVLDEQDLFLWIRIWRARLGDIYPVFRKNLAQARA